MFGLKRPPEMLGLGKSPNDVMVPPSSASKPSAGVGKLKFGDSGSSGIPIKADADSGSKLLKYSKVQKLEHGKVGKAKSFDRNNAQGLFSIKADADSGSKLPKNTKKLQPGKVGLAKKYDKSKKRKPASLFL